MGRKFGLLLLSATTISLLGGCKKEEKVVLEVSSVSFDVSLVNPYLLKGSSIDFTKSSYLITYTDGSNKKLNYSNSTISNTNYDEFGTHTCDISFNLNEKDYKFQFEYYIFDNNKELNFVRGINDLPYLNELTTSDVSTTMLLTSQLDELEVNEVEFIENYYPLSLERLEKTESFLIDLYFEEKSKALSEYYRSLNFGSFDENGIKAIQDYLNDFNKNSYSSLESIVEAYNLAMYNIGTVQRINVSIEEYRENTINSLINEFTISLGSVEKNDEEGDPYIYSPILKNYLEDEKYVSLKNEFVGKINALNDASAIDSLYSTTFSEIQKLIIDAVKEDANNQIKNIFNQVRGIEKELVDSWDDITISVFVLNEDGSKSGYLFTDIQVDYLTDNRWWTPEPYKPGTILDKSFAELDKQTSISDVIEKYNDLELEIVRSTLERNLELYYSIWRNYNPAYDTNDTLYWNNVATYWGDTVDRQFEYVGPLSDYYGLFYGNSSANQFRLVDQFYNSHSHNYRTTTESTLKEYFKIKSVIKPDDLAIKSITLDLSNAKTDYQRNEPIDISGGVINIVYNDTRKSSIPMTNDMIVGNIDTSTVGSHSVNIKFIDPRLSTEINQSFNIVVLSGGSFDSLVLKLSNLSLEDEINAQYVAKIEEASDLFNSLQDAEKTDFATLYSSEYNKLVALEKAASKLYFEIKSENVVQQYETLNLYVYANEAQDAIVNGYSSLIESSSELESFIEIDSLINEFETVLENAEIDSELLLDNFKTNTILSLDRMLTVEGYKYSGFDNNVRLDKGSFNLKDLLSNYDSLVNSINSCSAIDDVILAYEGIVNEIYQEVLRVSAEEATKNVKQAIFDLRSTAAQNWVVGEEDVITISGESGSEWTTNYLDDGGYYCWYTPNYFQTGYLYDNVSVNQKSTKRAIFEEYESCLVDVSRCTMWRNILTLYCVNGFKGPFWQYACYGDKFAYDGCVSMNKNVIVGTGATTSYRLWYDGFKPGEKQTSLSGLLERYNIDVEKFILK